MNVLRVKQVQTLGETGFLRAFAFAGAGGVRPTEHAQEIVGTVVTVVRQANRTRPDRQTAEVAPGQDQIVQRIEEDFCGQALGMKARVVMFVPPVMFVWDGTELIRCRGGNDAHQFLQVVAALLEMIRQCIEQFRMRRWVGRSKVILGIDQAPAKEMFPVTVHQRFCEQPVFILSHPVNQAMARIIGGSNHEFAAAQAGWLHFFVGLFVGHLRHAGPVKNDLLARPSGGCLAHAREKRHEPVIIVLRPFLVRMMMALGALQTRAKEQLRRVLHLRLLGTHLFKPRGRRALVDVARGRHDLPHKPVVRLVGVKALLDPVVKGDCRAQLRPVGAFVPQQRRPLVGKILGVLLTVQQSRDSLFPLVGRRVSEERLRLLNGWHAAGDVERHPAKVRRVGRQFRRWHPHRFQLRENELVHEVFLLGQLVHRDAQRDRCAEHRRLVLITNHHRNLAGMTPDGDQAGVVGVGVLTVVRLVHGGVRDVLDRAIRHSGEDDELLAGAWLHDALSRVKRDRLELGIVGLAVGHSLPDPLHEHPVIKRIGINPRASAVRQLPCRLEQEQTALRRGRENSAPASLAKQILVILLRLEAEQRQLETVLPTGFPVATAAVAAVLGEQWHDRVGEVHRPFSSDRLDLEWNRGRPARLDGRGDDALAVGQWFRQPVGDPHEAAWLGRENGVTGLVGDTPGDIGFRDEQLHAGIGPVKRDAADLDTVPTRCRDGQLGQRRRSSRQGNSNHRSQACDSPKICR